MKNIEIIMYKVDIDNLSIIENKINICNDNELELETPIIYRDSLNNICKLQSYNLNELVKYFKNKNIKKVCIPILSNSNIDKFKNGCLYWNVLVFNNFDRIYKSYWFNINGNKFKKTETELIMNENLLFTLIGKEFENVIIEDLTNVLDKSEFKQDNKELDICIKISKEVVKILK
jgi:hypothetical protein